MPDGAIVPHASSSASEQAQPAGKSPPQKRKFVLPPSTDQVEVQVSCFRSSLQVADRHFTIKIQKTAGVVALKNVIAATMGWDVDRIILTACPYESIYSERYQVADLIDPRRQSVYFAQAFHVS